VTNPLPLDGCRVLVVEDEFLLADKLSRALQGAGAQVIGPVGKFEAALALVCAPQPIDAAVLDLNLGGVSALPIADRLAERRVPVVFATGYDGFLIPPRYADVPACLKPVAPGEVVRALRQAMAAAKP